MLSVACEHKRNWHVTKDMHKVFHRPFKAWLNILAAWHGMTTVNMFQVLQLWELKI